MKCQLLVVSTTNSDKFWLHKFPQWGLKDGDKYWKKKEGKKKKEKKEEKKIEIHCLVSNYFLG